MADGPEVPGEWALAGSAEPPAAVLRRAISHVESLLHRLDPADAAAPPAAEGERILVEAGELTDRMRADARDSVTELIGGAGRETETSASIRASRQRALDLLTGAQASVDEARASTRRLLETLNETLTSLDASANSIESLLAVVHAYAEPPPRRPLGLLFGGTHAG